MFDAIKKILRKTPASEPEDVPPPTAIPSRPLAARPAFTRPAAATANAAVPARPAVAGDPVVLPFAAILAQLPKELCGKKSPVTDDVSIFSVPRTHVLEQLPRGAVRVPFGELRRAAPEGIFINSPEYDSRLVELPLAQILSQLGPQDYAPRARQKQVEVPAEITDIFGHQGEALAPVRVLEKNEIPQAPASAPRHRVPAAKPAKSASPPPGSVAVPAPAPSRASAHSEGVLVALADLAEAWPEPVRQEINQLYLQNARCELPAAIVGEALKLGRAEFSWQQIHGWIKPRPISSDPLVYGEAVLELPQKVVAPLLLEHCRASSSQKAPGPSEHTTSFFTKSAPVAGPMVTPKSKFVAPAAVPKPAASKPLPRPAVLPPAEPSAALPLAAQASEDKSIISVPLSAVSANWPVAVRKELDLLNLPDAVLELPIEAIEAGLKFGKVDYLWKQLCGWLKPCPPAALASPYAEARLELPLSVIAPLYLQQRNSAEPKRAPITLNIPDVFTSKGQAASPAPPPPPPAASPAPKPPVITRPAPVAPVTPVVVAPAGAVQKAPADLAELFGEPQKRNWTPNDIVHKTLELPGVAGALIALQDGLLVANCLPPTWKADTIAAFLPQMFGRMNQYAKELNIGEITSLALAVDQGDFQVFKAGLVYFAVLGRPGAALPVASLTLIATQLARHTK